MPSRSDQVLANRWPMPIASAPQTNHLADLTFAELEGLDKSSLIVILPIGATEAHGPHLPLSTDVIISEAMAENACTLLAHHGLRGLLAPAIAYSVADFAAGFSGTISIRKETAIALIEDIGLALASHGVRYLAFANAHLDPTHIGSLLEAKARLNDKIQVIFPNITRRPWALRLSDEFKSGACHAGQYEGSIVMAKAPELVRDTIRRSLPANPSSLSVAIQQGKTSFEAAGGPQAYFGSPAAASAEEGEQTISSLGEILRDAVLEEMRPSNVT